MARRRALRPAEILELLNDIDEGASEGEDTPDLFPEGRDIEPEDSSSDTTGASSSDEDPSYEPGTLQGL